MNEKTRAAILREIVLLARGAEVDEDEITTTEYAQEMGLGVDEAYHILMRLVDRGLLSKRRVVQNGHVVLAFKRVQKGEQE